MKWVREILENITFKRKLILFSIFLSMVPVLIVGLLTSYMVRGSIQEEVNRNHQIILKQIESQVDTFFKSIERSAYEIASHRDIENSVEVGIDGNVNLDQSLLMINTLQRYKSYSDINFEISLVYNQYDRVYSTRYGNIPMKEFPYATIAAQTMPKYTGSIVVSPNTYRSQNELLLIRTVPVFKQPAAGMLWLHVDTAKLTRFLQELNLEYSGKLLIVDDTGRIVISPDQDEVGTRLTSSNNLFHYWSNPDEFKGPFMLGGVDYSLTLLKSSFYDWTFIALTPVDVLTSKTDKITSLSWGVMAALGVFWVLVAMLTSHRLYYSIQKLLHKYAPEGGTVHKDGLKALDSYMQDMKSENEQLSHRIKEQRPYLKESLFHRLLRGEMTDYDMHQLMTNYGFPLKGNWYYVCLVQIDQISSFRQYTDKDRSLFMFALSKMVEEISEEKFPSIVITTQSGQVALIVGADKTTEETTAGLQELCASIRTTIDQYFQFTVTIAVSHPRKDYANLNRSYQEADRLMDYRLLMGSNITIFDQDVDGAIRRSSSVLIETQKRIGTSIAQGDFESANIHLDAMVDLLPRYVQTSEAVFGLFAHLIGEIYRFVHEMGHETQDIFEQDLYKELYRKHSLDEVRSWLSESVFTTIKSNMASLNVSKQKVLVQQMTAYIDEHLETDLSLQQVADQFNVSTYQVSRAFKEDKEINFINYVIELRMNKAKEWLVHTDMPIKEIAERLRYTSVHNFARIFKKTTGFPPGQYRSSFLDGASDHEDGK